MLLCAAIAFKILVVAMVARLGPDSKLAHAIGRDVKGNLSIALYAVATLLAFVRPWIAFGIYTAVAVIWFVPDRRIERRLGD